ncbi:MULTISPECIES: hypothetical protein [Sinorhizobium]|uniref:Uncharacterized protein n=1 Tax=Sinorhizobium psoraleae TaxID=520838 RepID=A0ABT4KH78_9HYPH|nr:MULTISPECIES: hypothetical protein [Sinorhizobium]MCZ4091325.1 hypothetical protein [Sinorhizobium psoraleae]MDK1389186.1 hypothetical protein [Sinorhizobium sp. 7-81]MDK1490795.1 hypothetical protein [Sinorhizobium sp. 8-89]NRP69583.1 hypothetical protein [Sinorhizobium psoraleae]
MLIDYLWLLVTAGGAFALGAALAYVVMRQKPLPPAVKEAQDRKVRKLYGESQEDKSQ